MDSKAKQSQKELSSAADKKKKLEAELLMATSKLGDTENRLAKLLQEEKDAHQRDVKDFNKKKRICKNLLTTREKSRKH